MDKTIKTYTAPRTEVLEMLVEQSVLAGSGGPYPQFEDEFGW